MARGREWGEKAGFGDFGVWLAPLSLPPFSECDVRFRTFEPSWPDFKFIVVFNGAGDSGVWGYWMHRELGELAAELSAHDATSHPCSATPP